MTVRIRTPFPSLKGLLRRWHAAQSDSAELLAVTMAADDDGQEIWAIVHSHTHSPAVPSPTDIRQAAWWPDSLYLLVSLSEDQADPETGEPGIRGWRIVADEIFEVELSR